MGSQARIAGAAALAVTATLALTVAPAVASARMVRIGDDDVPALAGVAPAVAPTTPMHVVVALRPRDPAALQAFVAAVSTPGSSRYRAFITPAQFARRFGPARATIARVRAALQARGLHPGPASAGGLSIPIAAPAGALERAFSLSLRVLALSSGRRALIPDAAPELSASAALGVESILGLNTRWAPHPMLARPDRPDRLRGGAASSSRAITGGAEPCAQAVGSAAAQHAYTIDQIASAYGFSGLYRAGDEGAGSTIALYELEPDDPEDIAAFQACYGTHADVSYVRVDGGAAHGPGSGEAALDIENTIGLAPASRVIVYQGPNSEGASPGSGPYDLYSTIINQDRANVISVSWGECEPSLGRAGAEAEHTLFEQATAQGQSIVSAAGDSGAQDCDNPGSAPDTRLAVDDPSSQPLVTGVGGTSLVAPGPPPTETVWNNAGTAAGGIQSSGAGGGGVSTFWPMAPPQADAATTLGVTQAVAAGRVCGHATGFCREVPDVAADADPNTGYLIYFDGSATGGALPHGWQGIGGTSGAAPVWAALLALADASAACDGSSIGDAEPALYAAASRTYSADFHDVTSGENDFTHTAGGQFAAAAGYDLASGLGSPDATPLARALCTDTLRLGPIAAHVSARHSPVAIRLRVSDVPGRTITFTARGLPPGLRLHRATGEITGRPSRDGRFIVHVIARDEQGSASAAVFTWTIGPMQRLAGLTLGRVGVINPVGARHEGAVA